MDLLVGDSVAADPLQPLQATLDGLPDDSALKAYLESVLSEAGGSLQAVRGAIGSWFDSRMEWLSGVYRRHAKLLLFGVSIAVVALWNVDAIRVTTQFYRDDALRAAVAAEAVSVVDSCASPTPSEGQPGQSDTGTEPAPSQSANADELRTCLGDEVKNVTKDIRLPVGWPDPGRHWYMRLLGWGIAVVAVSQGAPFWFDVLRRLTNARKP